MRFTKWIFFGYLLFIGLLAVGIGGSFTTKPPRDPDTLYTAYFDNIKSMDPAVCNDTLGAGIIGNVYETLYGYKYGVKPYELYPQLAAEMPVVSQDGLTYTIKLRHGIHFYDPYKEVFRDGVGPEMKAADVVYSWKRVADFQLASPNFSTFEQGRIAGIDDWNSYTEETARKISEDPHAAPVDYDRTVEGLKALDDFTIQIRLTKPWPQFKYQLAFGAGAVVSRAAVEHYGDRFNNRPVGTGPYLLSDHLPDQRISFIVNPGYRGRPDVDGGAKLADAERLPHIKRLQYEFFHDPLPAWYLFQEKLLDTSIIPKEVFEEAIDPKTLKLSPKLQAQGLVLDTSPDPSIYAIGFNMTDPVVGKNKALRQAMSMAYDREQYIQVYANGRGIVPNGPIPPSFPTYDPKAVDPYSQLNLTAANAKMVEARQLNGGPIPPLKFSVGGTDAESRQQTEFFVGAMKQIGVTVVPEYYTWARLQELIDSRDTQLFQVGWSPDYPDEQTFLQLFYGKNAPAGGIGSAAYSNPEFDKLYEAASVLERSPQRDEMYRKMAAIVNEDCPWLYLYYPVVMSLQYDWMGNIKTMDYGAGYRQFFTLDVARRRNASADAGRVHQGS